MLDYVKAERRLNNRWPLIGKRLRRWTCEQLAAEGSAQPVALLAKALKDPDASVRDVASSALRSLSDCEAVDALCRLWASERDRALEALIVQQGYVASRPTPVRVLSALKAGRPETIRAEPECVPVLLEATGDADPEIAQAAHATLRSLRDREAVDALCRLAIEEPEGPAAEICLQTGMHPSDPEESALFLFVTRRLDEYFQEDYEFQNLRAAYERAGPRVREHVMAVVRSGDRRCLGFFGTRKPLSQCSEREIATAIESALRHRDWPKLFRAFLELPLKYSFPLLEQLRDSSWEPEAEDLKVLYRNVLRESEGQALAPPAPPPATSPVFERWLAQGRGGEPARLSEQELLERLATAPPPEAVALVGALVEKGGSERAARAVQSSPHWLVRLAGYATGLCRIPLDQDAVEDDNYWVRELVRPTAVLELWPEKATPEDLQTLNAAPREAFTGKLGSARRLLRLILAWRLTTPEIEPVSYEAGEFAVQLEKAD